MHCQRDSPPTMAGGVAPPLGATPSHTHMWLAQPGTSDHETAGVRVYESQPTSVKVMDESMASLESLKSSAIAFGRIPNFPVMIFACVYALAYMYM